MSQAQIWIVIVGATAITYALRATFPLLEGRLPQPLWLERALRYVPAAVLAAIVTPAVFLGGPEGAEGVDRTIRIVAALLGAVAAWRSRSILITIAVGMAALYALGWLVGLLGG